MNALNLNCEMFKNSNACCTNFYAIKILFSITICSLSGLCCNQNWKCVGYSTGAACICCIAKAPLVTKKI